MSFLQEGPRMVGVAVLAFIAVLLWLAFLRRGAELTALGTILGKEDREGGVYIQQPVEVNRGFRTPKEIPIAESVAFELRLDGIPDPVTASFNTVKSRQFEIGQRVRVQYLRRGLGPLWNRITVLEMTPIESE